jgi:hypothetical protein
MDDVSCRLQSCRGLRGDISRISCVQDSKTSLHSNVFCSYVCMHLLQNQNCKCLCCRRRHPILHFQKCSCRCKFSCSEHELYLLLQSPSCVVRIDILQTLWFQLQDLGKQYVMLIFTTLFHLYHFLCAFLLSYLFSVCSWFASITCLQHSQLWDMVNLIK